MAGKGFDKACDKGFDEEELSISLSPSQIRRQAHGGVRVPEINVNSHPAPEISSRNGGMLPSNPGSVSQHREKIKAEQRVGAYNIIKTLGEGSFGKVKLAVHRISGQQVALKIISRKRLISRDMVGRVEREIEYLQLLRHPHIIKLYTVIKTHNEIIMVLEYAGGELFDYIVSNGRMPEEQARRFFQQMTCAVEYCHRHKVVHRDLKPENLLLDGDLNVKIADFGLSNIMTDGNFLKTSCGSPNYAAPEVISGKLYAGPEVDVWSCGVILYVLLIGRLPFDDDHIPSLFAKIQRGVFTIPAWCPDLAAQLIKKMLVVNPMHRATIDDIRQDPWFLKDLPAYLAPAAEEFINTGVDPNKAIKPSDIAPHASMKVQEKLHNEVTDKISKTMGYGKKDVEDALGAAEPSAIKDAYMIVRENKMMQVNPGFGSGQENPFSPNSPPSTYHEESKENIQGVTAAMGEVSISQKNQLEDSQASPIANSARSTSTVASSSPRGYVSKVGILATSVPAIHKEYLERQNAGVEDPLTTQALPDVPLQPRTPAEQQEAVRRLKPHSKNPVRLDDSTTRPQGMTPVAAKKIKPPRWQFGIRSRNAPWEALLCIYKALSKLGATWVADKDYDKVHAEEYEQCLTMIWNVANQSRNGHSQAPKSKKINPYAGIAPDKIELATFEPTKYYTLPGDPWHIICRWKKTDIRKHTIRRSGVKALEAYDLTTIDQRKQDFVWLRMEIQLYEMDYQVFLVDFKCTGYERSDGTLLEEKDVMSPFPFLDMAASLIMQLAEAD